MSKTALNHTELLALLREQKYTEIVDQASKISFSPLESPATTNIIAAALFCLGQFDECMEMLETIKPALASDPNFLSLYGATNRRLGKLDRAKEVLAAALQIDPRSKTIKNNYANTLIDMGNYSRAEAILNEVISEDPDYNDAKENLSRLLSLRQRNKAKDLGPNEPFMSSLANPQVDQAPQPTDPLVFAFSKDEVEGSGRRHRDRPRVSARQLQFLLKRLPNPSQKSIIEDQLKLAGTLVKEGHLEQVLRICSSVQRLSTKPLAMAYITASDAYIRLKKFREAEICLLHGMALGSKSLNIYINLASLAAIRQDFQLASNYLDEAHLIDPHSRELADMRKNLQRQSSKASEEPYRFELSWSEAITSVKAPIKAKVQ